MLHVSSKHILDNYFLKDALEFNRRVWPEEIIMMNYS